MAEVLLENLGKVYDGNVAAVKDLCLAIRDQEFVVLVGPSGCGKSTTLRMIAGLESITSGQILIDGVRVNDIPPKDRDIAMVFQSYALYPQMSVYENMAFGLKMRGVSRSEIDARVRAAAETLDITALLDRRPRALSGGQRQRVAVGRAIVRDPKVFLFDEPLSNLDAKLRVQMRAELVRLHRRLAATMIYVTHDQVEAMTMGDRIVILSEGEIQQVAPPLEIYQRPANRFVAEFIGSPPMNMIAGRVASGDGGAVFTNSDGSISLPVPAAAAKAVGRAVILGVRPEDLQLDAPADAAVITAAIEVVERMGAETMVFLRAGNQPLSMRTHGNAALPAEGALRVGVNMAQAHFFDAESGARIALTGEGG